MVMTQLTGLAYNFFMGDQNPWHGASWRLESNGLVECTGKFCGSLMNHGGINWSAPFPHVNTALESHECTPDAKISEEMQCKKGLLCDTGPGRPRVFAASSRVITIYSRI
ncbi:predicted protein [Sclerotinia sclerotiorum 1980 UF-70]|uniref:Uncharacterized protein n=1 Tax=Sclerotinia sclerotiorum (strain ATCC 18683 / 1980 / Ss-1) TaxID=665079 RepID=A7F8P6_SCLS1|nr:predicted protein [Sclerotinia sclerotiorum 1980 UF-70]EDN99117.1 predicted protein [Sclerotinia sclerotiorum 1980 UF-70]